MKKIQISPSILSADFSQLGKEIKKLEEGGEQTARLQMLKTDRIANIVAKESIERIHQ